MIAALLVLNAALSVAQESRADRALALLRQLLAVTMRVRRDGRWQPIDAAQLVPGDLIHIRLGLADIAAVSALAIKGILMAAVGAPLVAGLLATVVAYLALLDLAKVRLFRALAID